MIDPNISFSTWIREAENSLSFKDKIFEYFPKIIEYCSFIVDHEVLPSPFQNYTNKFLDFLVFLLTNFLFYLEYSPNYESICIQFINNLILIGIKGIEPKFDIKFGRILPLTIDLLEKPFFKNSSNKLSFLNFEDFQIDERFQTFILYLSIEIPFEFFYSIISSINNLNYSFLISDYSYEIYSFIKINIKKKLKQIDIKMLLNLFDFFLTNYYPLYSTYLFKICFYIILSGVYKFISFGFNYLIKILESNFSFEIFQNSKYLNSLIKIDLHSNFYNFFGRIISILYQNQYVFP